jgi:3-deoxy-D-manno-octulosonic-acid transferase
MYLLSPYLLFRLWWKGRRLPAYKRRISERFCWDDLDVMKFDIWIHAVSLGEVIAATPLVEAVLDKKWSVIITTMTPTGAEQVAKHFGGRVLHRYVPYDLLGVVKRFFKKIKPQIGVIMETELWPNLLAEAKLAGVPLFLANARLSERSSRGYLRFKFLFKPIVNQFAGVLAQSQEDAERFIALGVEAEKVRVLGNMKFDLQVHAVEMEQFQELKNCWGAQRTVFISASTHSDEEARIINQLKTLQGAIPGVLLLIAPRHPERFQEVYQLCLQQGFNVGLRSDPQTLSSQNEVIVLDSLGELLGFYQLSDYAFVGGSLAPVGGHNVLEPIAMNVPVLSGPHVHNFKTICRDLVEAKALILVDDVESLIAAIIQLHNDKALKDSMVQRAAQVLQSNKGAAGRYLSAIELASKAVQI